MDNWKKNLEDFKTKNHKEHIFEYELIKSRETIRTVVNKSIVPTFAKLLEMLSAFDELFIERKFWFGNESSSFLIDTLSSIQESYNNNEFWFQQQIILKYELIGFRKPKIRPFNIDCRLLWKLEDHCYYLYQIGNQFHPQTSQLYSQFYSQEEIEDIVNQCGQYMWDQIDREQNQS